MEIPIGAQVECNDGVCGSSAFVLINPVTERVTHLVVRESTPPQTEYIVSVDIVSDTIESTIQLNCSKAELEKMEPFIQTRFVEDKVPNQDFGYAGGYYGLGTYYYWPYVYPERTAMFPVEEEKIPPGELAITRGTRVQAKDGDIGRVDELVMDAESGCITHFVMREGHLWGKKDVIIPVSKIDSIHLDTVFLKLDKHEVESLPTIPLHRRWS
ncbi:MAG: PRC-barrel domain-containing protein [Omnitrophica WOR_2 bacterium]